MSMSIQSSRRRSRVLRGLSLALILALAARPERAVACPACQCGDPSWSLDTADGSTSTALRAALVFRASRTTHGIESTGQAVELDRRVSLIGSRSYGRGNSLTLTVPYVHRILDDISGGRTSTFALGDLDLRTQVRLAQRTTPVGFVTMGVSAAAAVPSGARLRDDFDAIVDVDAQPGLGSWAGAGGLWADTRSGRWGARATLELRAATKGWEGHKPPNTLLYSASVRHRFGRSAGLQLGIDGRNSGFDRYDGEPDRLSGGHTLFFSPRWSQAIRPTWGLQFGGQIPIILEDEPRSRETGGFEVGLHWGS